MQVVSVERWLQLLIEQGKATGDLEPGDVLIIKQGLDAAVEWKSSATNTSRYNLEICNISGAKGVMTLACWDGKDDQGTWGWGVHEHVLIKEGIGW